MSCSYVYLVYNGRCDSDFVRSFKTRASALKYAAANDCLYVLRVSPDSLSGLRYYYMGVDY